MLLLDVGVESVRYRVEVFFPQTAYEAVAFHICLHIVELISKLTKRVDNQTCENRRVSNHSLCHKSKKSIGCYITYPE